jgi:Concanavalin A-like lectin/glucanases superfamily
MKVQKPIIHGRDHLPSGADPIVPFAAGGDYATTVVSISGLIGYWRLGEPASPWADTSGEPGGPRNMTIHAAGDVRPLTADVTGALPADQDDGAVKFNYDSSTPTGSGGQYLQAAAGTGFFDLKEMTVACFARIETSVDNRRGEIIGNSAWAVTGSGFRLGWALQVVYPTMTVRFTRGQPGAFGPELFAETPGALVAGEWYHLAATYDGANLILYVNGTVAGTATDTSDAWTTNSGVRIGYAVGNFEHFWLVGTVDEAAVWNRALTASEVATLYNVGVTAVDGGATGSEGKVLTVGPDGSVIWAPPTVEVSGGGVNPAPVDETPADSSHPSATGPTTSSGWHLNGHFETVVLHDPNPGRFDVPTMKWTRVPFTSITIYRTWEPTIDAEVLKTARLKDDRGLMQAAKDGILHVTSDMCWPDAPPMHVYIDDDIVAHPEHHLVEGWFSIEYPVLDALYLPENDVELLTLGPTPDAPRPGVSVIGQDGYQRGSRFMNVSTGSVLRFHPGSTARAIVNWWFGSANADNSTGAGDGPGTGSLDNPFPIWGDWPARPIHMTPPYPQLNPTESRAYYKDYQGMAGLGFGPYRGVTAGTNLSAGANLCMQAWQDTPWLLRFSTARFPAYRGFDQDYNGFPHLAVTYHYDPDTINHTTGRLLLPAT